MKQSGGKIRITAETLAVSTWILGLVLICAPAARAQSWGEVVLHSFDLGDGGLPYAGLIQGIDGNFYGTTEEGGAAGTVFQLTPSGTLTTLHWFTGGADGGWPYAGLIQGIDGNFYGTTWGGGSGTYPGGTVFKITPSGTLTTLYSFCSQTILWGGDELVCTDGENPYAGLIQGIDGNFYGTTQYGGTIPPGVVGTVFKITPSGTLTTLYSFCSAGEFSRGNCLDGAWPVAGLIQGIDGNFYGTTKGGGANDDGTVFQLTPSGGLTTLYSFCSQSNCTDGALPYAGLIQGIDGNFYGTTIEGGPNIIAGTVFKLTPSGTLTTLHSFCSQSSGGAPCPDGAEPAAGLIQGIDGSFYGTTYWGGANYGPGLPSLGAGTVFKITPSGTLTTLYSFCSEGGTACTDGEDPSAGLIQGSDGNFYGTTYAGGANDWGTVFEVGASLPTPSATATPTSTPKPTQTPKPTKTPTATPTPGHIKVIPTKLTLKAEPNAAASASITIENTGTGQVTVEISEPKHDPPYSESGGGSQAIGAGGNHQVTIVYSPTSSTKKKEKSDSITVTAISNDPKQKKPIKVTLKGEN
jgi:uncharacterized repeat protein (TIGR03803 family)